MKIINYSLFLDNWFQTTPSQIIAEKFHKSHDKVLRDIEISKTVFC
jgi:phage regulator Rha-like protein